MGAPEVYILPRYQFGGDMEQVPGSQQRPCHVCHATLTATPSSYERVDADPTTRFFLCDRCGEELREMVPMSELRRAPGADEELRAAGMDDVVKTDRLLLQRLKARES